MVITTMLGAILMATRRYRASRDGASPTISPSA
jgi:hypothetical protein